MPRNKTEEVQDLTTGTSFAANGAFTTSSVSANGLHGRRGERRSGWDPYEVWRTRVKTATRAKQVRGEKFLGQERGRLSSGGNASRVRPPEALGERPLERTNPGKRGEKAFHSR